MATGVTAVLGCGPAGLFAAQALSLHGFEPVIFSKKQKSVLYGAQFLHKPIPGLSPSLPTGSIRVLRVGRPEVYAERVYGLATMPTSWDRVVPEVAAWDLRETYDVAWEKFQDRIADVAIGPEDVKEFTAEFDMVVSTIPAWAICEQHQGHYFKSQNILVRKDIDFLDGAPSPHEHWIVYNGTHDMAWYRASCIFGHKSVEARAEPHLVLNKKWEPGFKVVGTDCDCHPTVVKAGRMGRWERGVLTHHAFERTIEAIADQFGAVHPGTAQPLF